MCTLW